MRRLVWLSMMAAAGCAGSTSPLDGDARAAATPTFSPPAGVYATTQSVTISSTTPGAVIHCTQNGATPTAASPSCASPISVSATKTLKAIAAATGYLDSAVATASYTIDAAPRAATPTFWPPEGVYSTTQSVTISSTTSGAVIHCTQDGATPTAASPTCASPISVSATKTLKAIATATGYTDSAVGSATYTIGTVALAQKLAALSTKRQWFMHQSVGNQIMNGLEDWPWGTSGLFHLLGCTTYDCPATSPGYLAGVKGVHAPTAMTAIPAGSWAEGYTDQFQASASNYEPLNKVAAFDSAVRTRFSGCDYVGLKFCFVDISGGYTPAQIFSTYQTTMDALEALYPGKLIYWTMPLAPSSDAANNTLREQLNASIRTRYASTGRLFDIADWESRNASGALVLANGVRALNAAWNGDGQGHVNAAGANMLAQKYLDFMYRVATAP